MFRYFLHPQSLRYTSIVAKPTINKCHFFSFIRRKKPSQPNQSTKLSVLLPPNTPKPRKTIIKHLNKEYIDEYAWLQNLQDENVVKYIKQENEYAHAMLNVGGVQRLRRSLIHQLGKVMAKDELQIAGLESADNFMYLVLERHDTTKLYLRRRIEKGESMQSFIAQMMKPECLKEWKTILDEQELQNEINGSVISGRISDCHTRIALVVDTTGDNNCVAIIRDVESEKTIETISHVPIVNIEFGIGDIVYYTVADEKKRPFKVMQHVIGSDFKKDVELFNEMDDSFFVDVTKTKDKKYVKIISESKTTNEVRIMDPTESKLQLVQPRKPGVIYHVEHNQGRFFIVTTENEKSNFKVATIDCDKLGKEKWKDFIQEDRRTVITDLDVFKEYMVLYEKHDGLVRIRIVNIHQKDSSTIPNTNIVNLPQPLCKIQPGMNSDFNSTSLIFSYSTVLEPDIECQLDLKDAKISPLFTFNPIEGYNPENYTITRVFVTSHDEVSVPLTLVYRKDLQLDGSNPVILTGYGAYGECTELEFVPQRLVLLKRGFIFAFAHVRGGGELGKEWYHEGKRLKKLNSFHDFIACAEYLINKKYTSKSKLCAKGVSAGGLLVASSVNMRPELFHSVILKVPFLDVTHTMLNDLLPLTTHEYEEWGNINDEEVFEYIRSYSPYDNIKEQNYPHMYITTSLNDFRAPYWNALKYVAKLRSKRTNQGVILLKITDHGHYDEAGKYGNVDDIASEYAFICKTLGVNMKS